MYQAPPFLFLLLLLVGCGQPVDSGVSSQSTLVTPRASVSLDLKTDSRDFTAINSWPTTFSVDTSKFIIPPIHNAILEFGTLSVAKLNDNQLSTCGMTGKSRCTQAMLRLYTIGVSGAGLFNVADGYGAPLFSSLTSKLTVGLGAANAAIMQRINIPRNKRNVTLADFSPKPNYKISADFTNAGAGDYRTTLVFEYALQ